MRSCFSTMPDCVLTVYDKFNGQLFTALTNSCANKDDHARDSYSSRLFREAVNNDVMAGLLA